MSMKKLLTANAGSGRRRTLHVFRDFCEISAIAIRNAVDASGYSDRESRYLSIITNYSTDEINRFAATLAELTMAIESDFSDVLGHLYMCMEFGNEALGQVFTPYSLSRVMAKIVIDDIDDHLEQQGFITVNDLACGSGGMFIAVADSLQEQGINYQKALHVTAQDIDITAVHMTYIQLSLLHVPAVVIHGDTLAQTQLDIWPTPAHVIDRWSDKLRQQSKPQKKIFEDAS
ncbi:N-6 DNA methylase [Streptomyces sp. NPDC007083]|uniref:N-6 DNA methylase n=1 Tax=Streptomyces sp. NPDC007083 TaxID=3156913 RepID=UPI0033E77EAA